MTVTDSENDEMNAAVDGHQHRLQELIVGITQISMADPGTLSVTHSLTASYIAHLTIITFIASVNPRSFCFCFRFQSASTDTLHSLFFLKIKAEVHSMAIVESQRRDIRIQQ